MRKLLILLITFFLVGCQPEPVDIDAAVEAYMADHLTEIQANVNIELNEFNDLMVEVIEKVDPSVLAVLNVNDLGQGNGSGSAVVYKEVGGFYYAITNNHVVEGSVTLRVYFSDYLYEEAELIGTDPDSDLAVIKFQSTRDVGVSTFGDVSELRRGQTVIAIGSPSGLTYYNSVTMGIIGGLDRFIGIEDTDNDGNDDVFVKMLQHDAAINPGNSGGPLFNLEGEIVGINTIKLVSDDIEGMGFSIPTDVTLRVIEDLEEFGVVKRSRLGVWIADIRYIEEAPEGVELGAYISDIVEDGPVDSTSDLEVGDVIVEFAGVSIDGIYRLKDAMFIYHPGDEVEVKYFRDGQTLTTTIILGEK